MVFSAGLLAKAEVASMRPSLALNLMVTIATMFTAGCLPEAEVASMRDGHASMSCTAGRHALCDAGNCARLMLNESCSSLRVLISQRDQLGSLLL